jgi:hypothetical protein
MNMKQKISIGIDPDCTASGFAVWYKETNQMELYTFNLYNLFMKLVELDLRYKVVVYLEAGHLMKGMWHKGGFGAAKRVGANHEITRQIERFMIDHGMKYHLIKPQGYSSYSHETFCNITGWPKKVRTNSEKRVAGLMAYRR